MLLRLTRPLLGYGLCLCSWLMLTLGIPLSSALAATDAGWIRICSTQGVHWLAPQSESAGASLDDPCSCLCAPLLSASEPTNNGAMHAASAGLPLPTPCLQGGPPAQTQPRAPPALL